MECHRGSPINSVPNPTTTISVDYPVLNLQQFVEHEILGVSEVMRDDHAHLTPREHERCREDKPQRAGDDAHHALPVVTDREVDRGYDRQ